MSALLSAVRQIQGRFSQGDYSASLISDVQTAVAASPTAYTQQVYSYAAASQAVGADAYQLGAGWFWFVPDGEDYDRSAVDAARVQNGIDTYGARTDPLLVDIEEWDMSTETSVALTNLELALSMWHAQSARPIGMFRLVPYSDYFLHAQLYDAVNTSDATLEVRQRALFTSWMRLNDSNWARLGQYCDFLCPKVYVQYDNQVARWKYYAAASVLEAIRLADGKPVYPIVWWAEQAEAGDPAMTEAEWIASLQFVCGLDGIGGIMLYTGGTAPVGYTYTDAISNIVLGEADFATPP